MTTRKGVEECSQAYPSPIPEEQDYTELRSGVGEGEEEKGRGGGGGAGSQVGAHTTGLIPLSGSLKALTPPARR